MIACAICQDEQLADHSFSPLRFAQYANDLSTAVYDLAEEANLRDYGFKNNRLTNHRANRDTKIIAPPKLRQPMNDLPPNELTTSTEPLKTSITGASFLGEKFKTDIALAKLKIELAAAQITTAVQDIHAAGDHGLKLAKTLQAEADDLKAAFGQASNGGPH